MTYSELPQAYKEDILAAIFCTVISCLIIILRFVSKASIKSVITLDDWLILVGLAMMMICGGVLIWGTFVFSKYDIEPEKLMLGYLGTLEIFTHPVHFYEVCQTFGVKFQY